MKRACKPPEHVLIFESQCSLFLTPAASNRLIMNGLTRPEWRLDWMRQRLARESSDEALKPPECFLNRESEPFGVAGRNDDEVSWC